MRTKVFAVIKIYVIYMGIKEMNGPAGDLANV